MNSSLSKLINFIKYDQFPSKIQNINTECKILLSMIKVQCDQTIIINRWAIQA